MDVIPRLAAEAGHYLLVRFLADSGADVDAPVMIDGRSPAFLAATNGHADVLLLLANHGADLEAPARRGAVLRSRGVSAPLGAFEPRRLLATRRWVAAGRWGWPAGPGNTAGRAGGEH